MRTFAITIATITGLLAHQAVAAEMMIQIERDDHSHFILRETSKDGISNVSKCAALSGHPIDSLSVRNPYTCYLFLNDQCGGNNKGNGKKKDEDWDYLQFRGSPAGSASYGMLTGLKFLSVRCDKA